MTNSLGFHKGPSASKSAVAPAAVRVDIKSAPRRETTRADIPEARLIKWNLGMSAFHLTLAITTLIVGNVDLVVDWYKVVLDFVPGEIPSGANTTASWTLVPRLVKVGGLPFTVLTSLFFFLSFAAHFSNATLLRRFYLAELRACRTPTRWIEYFFSASLMQLLIAYTLGLRERANLLAAAVLVGVTMPFGYWTEQISRPADDADEWTKPFSYRILPWVVGHVPQVASWFLVLWQFFDTAGAVDRAPWFVTVILWGELALFFSFGFVQLGTACMPPSRFWQGELAFQVLSLTSKALLGGLLIAFVVMSSNFDDIYD